MKKLLSIFIVLLIGVVAFCGCNEAGVDENNNNKGGENTNVSGQGTPPRKIFFSTVKEIEDFVALKDCTEKEYQTFLDKNESVYSYEMNGMSTPEDVAVFAQNIENGGYPRFTNEDQTFGFTYYPHNENYTLNYYVNDIRYCFEFCKNHTLEKAANKVLVGQKNIGDEKVDMYRVGENYYGLIHRNDYNIYIFVYKCEFEDIDFSTVIF